jgi:hypothetical protein
MGSGSSSRMAARRPCRSFRWRSALLTVCRCLRRARQAWQNDHDSQRLLLPLWDLEHDSQRLLCPSCDLVHDCQLLEHDSQSLLRPPWDLAHDSKLIEHDSQCLLIGALASPDGRICSPPPFEPRPASSPFLARSICWDGAGLVSRGGDPSAACSNAQCPALPQA